MHVSYDAYIQSGAWRSNPAREQELQLAGHRCRLCNRSHPKVRLELHHRSYARFTRELAEDLTALCSECHEFVTECLRRRRYAESSPPSVPDVMTPNPRPLRDPFLWGEP